jgi:hypothetical protein
MTPTGAHHRRVPRSIPTGSPPARKRIGHDIRAHRCPIREWTLQRPPLPSLGRSIATATRNSSTSTMRYLDAQATRSAISMQDAIGAMRDAFTADREVSQRQQLGSSLFMSGRVGTTSGIKVVSTEPGNPLGIVVVFSQDGTPLGFVDGPTLTAIRTGAVAGLATDLLADPSASTLAILGSGAMAPDQIAAIAEVRPIDNVLVWSRNFATAATLADRLGATPVRTANDAVAVADVITTATPALTPLFDHTALPRQRPHQRSGRLHSRDGRDPQRDCYRRLRRR